jgi:CRISPR-associated protein Cmr3
MAVPGEEKVVCRLGLVLDPLDVLFFRDGRPFEAGYHLGSGLPLPQTLAGALRTAMLSSRGFDFRAFSKAVKEGTAVKDALRNQDVPEWIIEARFLGPWLALVDRKDVPEPLLSVPASLVFDGDKGEWIRMDPLRGELPGWNPSGGYAGLRPLWIRGRARAKARSGFLRLSGIKAFLEGGVPKEGDFVRESELFSVDQRTGIVIDPETLAAQEGMIYSAGMVALNPGIGKETAVKLYCEVLFQEPTIEKERALADGETIPLGGQSRYVACRQVDPVDWPEGPGKSSGDGELLLLASPGIFRRGWQPDLPEACRWVSAAVSGSLAVSGWDVAMGGPKPTRFAVPAGSVFFAEGEVKLPESRSLCQDEEDAAQGWGFTLKGVWNHV